jgi:hypothetical protein
MINYGFKAVQTWLVQMNRLHATLPIARLANKTFFRIADRSPMLQKRMIDAAQ